MKSAASILFHQNAHITKEAIDAVIKQTDLKKKKKEATNQMFKAQYFKLHNLNSALFLTFLGCLGGFIGGGLAAKSIQRIIGQYAVVKNGILFLLIWFTSSFTAGGAGESPAVHVVQAVMLYVLFVLLMKTTMVTFLIAAALLLGTFVLGRQISYMDAHDLFHIDVHKEALAAAPGDEGKKKAAADAVNKRKKFELAQDILGYVAIAIVLVGVGLYMRKQMRDKAGSFNVVTFFMGADATSEDE